MHPGTVKELVNFIVRLLSSPLNDWRNQESSLMTGKRQMSHPSSKTRNRLWGITGIISVISPDWKH